MNDKELEEYNAKEELEAFAKAIAKVKHHSAYGKATLLWREGYRLVKPKLTSVFHRTEGKPCYISDEPCTCSPTMS